MTWQPSSVVEEEWGWIQVVIGGRQRNMFRGAHTMIEEYSLEEPYTYGPATLLFPSIYEFDVLGEGDLDWLHPNAHVELNRIGPEGNRRKTLWAGFVMLWDQGPEGCRVSCGGAFSGRLGIWQHRVPLVDKERDVLDHVTREVWSGKGQGGMTYTPHVQSGISTRKRGSRSQTALDFLDEMLAEAQTADGGQWTIYKKSGMRHFSAKLKDRTTQDATVHVGGRGVVVNLRKDPTANPNVMYGEGVASNGGRWGGTVYPNLLPETLPAYPYTDTSRDVVLGDTDDTVDRWGQIRVWHVELASNGRYSWFPSDRDGVTMAVYGQDSVEACEKLQEDVGLPVTGRLDYATWQATWQNGLNGSDLSGAHYSPLAYGPGLHRFRTNINGSVIGRDPNFDPQAMRVEGFLSFGEGVRKERGRKDAKKIVTKNANPGWYGTIDLTCDPEEMSRLELEAGMNIRPRRWASGPTGQGPLLHIAGITVRPEDEGCPVSLTVDERARDLLTVAQIIQRDREARQDPAKNILNQRRQSTTSHDSFVGWDSEAGAGLVPHRQVHGGRWTIIKVVGAQFGRLIGIDVHTDHPRRLAVAIFGNEVHAELLNNIIPDPLTEVVVGDAGYVKRGQVSAAAWDILLDNAWYQDGDDGLDALYPPSAYGGSVIWGDVTTAEWNALLIAGWGGKADDGQEALYRPDPARKYAPFNLPRIQDVLEDRQWLESWGGPEQAAGYWPGQETNERGEKKHPLTGRLRDSASAEFASGQAPWLWMAVYVDGEDTNISGRLYAASEE